jgi:hypothetical protein
MRPIDSNITPVKPVPKPVPKAPEPHTTYMPTDAEYDSMHKPHIPSEPQVTPSTQPDPTIEYEDSVQTTRTVRIKDTPPTEYKK